MTLGSYELDSFDFTEGKLTWKVLISGVRLVPEKIVIDSVVASFVYQKGRKVSVVEVKANTISGEIPTGDPESVGKRIEAKVKEIIQAILDSSERLT